MGDEGVVHLLRRRLSGGDVSLRPPADYDSNDDNTIKCSPASGRLWVSTPDDVMSTPETCKRMIKRSTSSTTTTPVFRRSRRRRSLVTVGSTPEPEGLNRKWSPFQQETQKIARQKTSEMLRWSPLTHSSPGPRTPAVKLSTGLGRTWMQRAEETPAEIPPILSICKDKSGPEPPAGDCSAEAAKAKSENQTMRSTRSIMPFRSKYRKTNSNIIPGVGAEQLSSASRASSGGDSAAEAVKAKSENRTMRSTRSIMPFRSKYRKTNSNTIPDVGAQQLSSALRASSGDDPVQCVISKDVPNVQAEACACLDDMGLEKQAWPGLAESLQLPSTESPGNLTETQEGTAAVQETAVNLPAYMIETIKFTVKSFKNAFATLASHGAVPTQAPPDTGHARFGSPRPLGQTVKVNKDIIDVPVKSNIPNRVRKFRGRAVCYSRTRERSPQQRRADVGDSDTSDLEDFPMQRHRRDACLKTSVKPVALAKQKCARRLRNRNVCYSRPRESSSGEERNDFASGLSDTSDLEDTPVQKSVKSKTHLQARLQPQLREDAFQDTSVKNVANADKKCARQLDLPTSLPLKPKHGLQRENLDSQTKAFEIDTSACVSIKQKGGAELSGTSPETLMNPQCSQKTQKQTFHSNRKRPLILNQGSQQNDSSSDHDPVIQTGQKRTFASCTGFASDDSYTKAVATPCARPGPARVVTPRRDRTSDDEGTKVVVTPSRDSGWPKPVASPCARAGPWKGATSGRDHTLPRAVASPCARAGPKIVRAVRVRSTQETENPSESSMRLDDSDDKPVASLMSPPCRQTESRIESSVCLKRTRACLAPRSSSVVGDSDSDERPVAVLVDTGGNLNALVRTPPRKYRNVLSPGKTNPEQKTQIHAGNRSPLCSAGGLLGDIPKNITHASSKNVSTPSRTFTRRCRRYVLDNSDSDDKSVASLLYVPPQIDATYTTPTKNATAPRLPSNSNVTGRWLSNSNVTGGMCASKCSDSDEMSVALLLEPTSTPHAAAKAKLKQTINLWSPNPRGHPLEHRHCPSEETPPVPRPPISCAKPTDDTSDLSSSSAVELAPDPIQKSFGSGGERWPSMESACQIALQGTAARNVATKRTECDSLFETPVRDRKDDDRESVQKLQRSTPGHTRPRRVNLEREINNAQVDDELCNTGADDVIRHTVDKDGVRRPRNAAELIPPAVVQDGRKVNSSETVIDRKLCGDLSVVEQLGDGEKEFVVEPIAVPPTKIEFVVDGDTGVEPVAVPVFSSEFTADENHVVEPVVVHDFFPMRDVNVAIRSEARYLYFNFGWNGENDGSSRQCISDLLGFRKGKKLATTHLAWVTCGKCMVAACILSAYRYRDANRRCGCMEFIVSKQRGCARRLVESAKSLLHGIGATALYSGADLSRPLALTAHEKWGFRRVSFEEWAGSGLKMYAKGSVCYMGSALGPSTVSAHSATSKSLCCSAIDLVGEEGDEDASLVTQSPE